MLFYTNYEKDCRREGVEYNLLQNKRFKNTNTLKQQNRKSPSIKNTGGSNDPPVRFYIEESVD